MHIDEAIRGRRSVRRFLDRSVPRTLICDLVKSASMAPSASNRQAWEITVVASLELRRRLAEVVKHRWDSLLAACGSDQIREIVSGYAHNFSWFASAPVVLVVSCYAPEAFMVDLVGSPSVAADTAGMKISAAMAAQNLMLAAHAAGLGTCCLTGPVAAADELRPLLGLGRRRELVCLIALGYPAEQPPAPSRKPVDEILRFTGG